MTFRLGSIIVFVSFLSFTTLTVSCRQHRTPKSITFKRITKTKNKRQSDENHYSKEFERQECTKILDSLFQICTPAPLLDCPEQIIRRIAYVLSYNKETKLPNWVAWHLTAEHIDGNLPRDNNYYEDESVPIPRATNDDYKGSEWTRGHMCPAGDNKWDSIAMRESNLLTNICPQHSSLNSGLWNAIERDCRKWALKYGDIFIVCGPIFYNVKHQTIGTHEIVVPEAFFKVILCLTGNPKAIGFVIKNNDGKKKKDQYINTIDEVERITSMDFFSALPDSLENEVEASANIEEWK